MKTERLCYHVKFWGKGLTAEQHREYHTSDDAKRIANFLKEQGFKVEIYQIRKVTGWAHV